MRKEIYYSLGAEVAALTSFFFMQNFYQVIFVLASHLIACILISPLLLTLLPDRYKKHKGRSLILLVSLGFFLFVPGYVLLLITTIYLLRTQKVRPITNMESFSIEELFTSNVLPKISTLGEGPLYIVSKIRDMDEKKFNVLSSLLLEMKNPRILDYLSTALGSRHDELRLYIFSTLLRLEKSIQERISLLNKNLENNISDTEKAITLFELAQSYYDLVYFKLVDKELERITLQKAEEYLTKAINIRKNPEFYILMGKIKLVERNYALAEEFLLKALNLNHIHPIRYIPYIAEVYFSKGEYQKVKKIILENLEYLKFSANPYIYYIVEFWRDMEWKSS